MTTPDPDGTRPKPETQAENANARQAQTALWALFVGGPLDGQVRQMDATRPWIRYEASWPHQVDSLDFLKSLSMTPDEMLLAYRNPTVRYEFSRWQIGPLYVNLMIPDTWLYGYQPMNPVTPDKIKAAVIRAVVATADVTDIMRIT